MLKLFISDNIYHNKNIGGIQMKRLLSIILSLAFVLTLTVGATSFAAKKTYVDGTYKATYDFVDSHGWKPTLTVTIKGDKITAAKFDYVNPAGKLKTKDAAYNASMRKFSKTKTYPSLYCAQLGQSLIAKQNVAKVDVVTGATSSSTNFKALATAALTNAKKGIKAPAILVMNDTYTATEAAFDSRGWKAQVSLTYKNGKLVTVVYDYLNKDNKKKSEDAAYNTSMKAKSGISSKEATEKLAANYLASGSTDVVTGATSSSKLFKDLVEKAKAMRQ
jgi:major membrane immunogen (membrane-anchored lipoprotein)